MYKTFARALHVHNASQPLSSYGAKYALPRCTHVPSLVSLGQSFLKTEDPCQKSFPPLARAACAPQERHPQRILSWGGMGVTCEFDIGSAPRLTCRCVNVFLQTFSGRHVPRATCRQSTPDWHQRRSGVSGRRPVPPPSRSNQPFGRYSPKCLDIHTD